MTQAVINYAKVLYELNVRPQTVDEAKSIVLDNKELMTVLSSPVVTLDKKCSVIQKVFPQDISNFIKVVCKNGRISLINEIFNEYENFYNIKNGIINAKLYYLTKPTEAQQDKFKEFIKKKFGAKTVNLELIEKPQLIGGFILEVNGHEFDRSFEGKLNALNRKLVWR